MMNHWQNLGPEWKTETAFQVREILKSEHIPFRMPFSDVFFASFFHLPAEDKRWGILVRRKDWERAVKLLARDGLANPDALMKQEPTVCPAAREQREIIRPAAQPR